MGYSTDFKGVLKFKKELTSTQLGKLNSFLGEDCREHPEWNRKDLSYIDLELTDDFSGIQWDGSEKTYDLVEKVQLVIDQMKKEYPDFELEGEILAQGEDIEDRWFLVVENNVASRRDIAITGTKIKCPHCGEHFILES